MLWASDASGDIVFFSAHWQAFRGQDRETELKHRWEAGLHPEDLEATRRAFARAHRDHESLAQEFRLRRWDNEFRWMFCTGNPQFDASGGFTGLVGTCVDITDRRRWEDSLRQRDRLLHAVAQSTHAMLEKGALDQSLPGMLMLLAEAMEVDRAAIFQILGDPQSGELEATCVSEWCNDRLPPQLGQPAAGYESPAFRQGRLYHALHAGKPHSGLAADMPEDERLPLLAQRIRSFLRVPIPTSSGLWGFLSFDDTQNDRLWSANEMALIGAMAGSLGVLVTREESARLVRARDRLLRGVAQATQVLLSSSELEQSLRQAMAVLGEAADVERACLFENVIEVGSQRLSLQPRILWTRQADGAPAPPRDISYDELLPRWHEILSAGQPISGRVLDLLPRKAGGQELRSVLLVPVMSGERFWGVAGFDDGRLERKWNVSDEDLLKAVASSIGAAIVRRGAEDRLRAREEHYRSLIENVSDIIAIVDAHGLLTYLSPAAERALGYKPSDLTGRSVALLLHPDDAFNLMQVRKVLLAKPNMVRMAEFRLKHSDGSWRVFESAGKVLESRGGQRDYVITARDITERRKTEEALRRSEEQLRHSQKMEAVGRLAGGVAHDFNNLLTAISGYAELISEELPPESKHEAEEIIKATDRAHALTRQLLAFSRKQVLEPRLFNLNTIVLDLQKMLRRLIGEDIELLTELDPDPGLVRVDAGQMEQMIINLAVNARDAMPRGGRLTLRTSRVDLIQRIARDPFSVDAGAYVLLEVSDNGKGMDDSIKEHLFEPFFTTKDVGKGTGLGLSMVYGIVRQSGGHILVESAPGQGATFSIYLPRINGREAARRPPVPADAARGDERILLVEDEDLVRQLTARMLTQQGYTVVTANDGREALDIMDEQGNTFQALLTDVVMPHIGGPALVDRLRGRYPALKVLYMSGYTQDALEGNTDIKPGRNFIQKPFKPAALFSLLRDVLDAR